MTLTRVRFTARARLEIQAVADWWAVHRTAAPDAVRDEIESAVRLLAEHPKAGAMAVGSRLRDIRRLHLPRIRYYLYYRQTPDAGVEVLALWHTSRGSSPGL